MPIGLGTNGSTRAMPGAPNEAYLGLSPAARLTLANLTTRAIGCTPLTLQGMSRTGRNSTK
jgi:hypothetical protein